MLNKFKKRSGAVRFQFSLRVHSLAPWPAVDKAVAIGWQRGSKKNKRGATASKMPQQMAGRLGAAVEFEESFQLSATMYMDGGSRPSTTGPFKKKAIVLAVLETERSGETKSLGRVVIDLAHYAAPLNEVRQDFDIACSKSIQSAVGTPKLSVSLRCTWKGASGPGSAASSHSSDTTGSALTSNLSTFWHKKDKKDAKKQQISMTGEQVDDLKGFEHLANRPSGGADSPTPGMQEPYQDSPNPPATDFPRLNTIRESEREYLRHSVDMTHTGTHDGTHGGAQRAKHDAIAEDYDADGVLRDSDLDSEPNPPANNASGANPPPRPTDRVSSWLASALDGSGRGSKAPEKKTREQEVQEAARSLLNALGSDEDERREEEEEEGSAGSEHSDHDSGKGAMESPFAEEKVNPSNPASVGGSQGKDAASAAIKKMPSQRSEAESVQSRNSDAESLPAQQSSDSLPSRTSGAGSLKSLKSRRGSRTGSMNSRRSINQPVVSRRSTGDPLPSAASAAESLASRKSAAESLPSTPSVTETAQTQKSAADPLPVKETTAEVVRSQQSAPKPLPSRRSEPGARSARPGTGSEEPKLSKNARRSLPEPLDRGKPDEQSRTGKRSPSTASEPSTNAAQGRAPRRWARVFDKQNEGQKSPTPGKTKDAEKAPRKAILGIPLQREKTAVPARDESGMQQLRTAAFLEASVYLARSGRHRDKARNTHAPARRIARTVVALGPEQGAVVGRNALKAIKAMVDGAGTNISAASFWWTNCVHLRLLLPTLATKAGREAGPGQGKAAATSSVKDAHWAVKALTPQVVRLEKYIFDRVEQYLWWKVLMSEAVKTVRRMARMTSSCSSVGSPGPETDIAVSRWLTALNAVNEQFLLCSSGKVLEGHVPLLKTQVLRNCMKRMDMMLFQEMLADAQGEDGEGIVVRASSETMGTALVDDVMGGGSEGWPILEDSMLPFNRGPLTFGVGMNLKMAVTRWSEWAFTVDATGSEPSHSLFPLLTAAADLLMMPKELLTDKGVRDDIFAALSLGAMCCILERYQPDDFAPEPITPAVQEQLDAELKDTKSPALEVRISYQQPDAAAIGRLDEGAAVDMDSESEEDLDELDALYERCGDEGPPRFEVLKDLWGRRPAGAAGAKR
ncbi:unnamed protein product [Ostreobium quekettii]|uniref:C2 NT-type domain-containing protein n=1 Tax=Ostreobium quekettii TaxID=121088 RepID=A0A8S1IME7_9CHLO|nr:unnamed protein product [Ostreobium quekettii]|eukprot:evm.model.scf_271.5 EVM.evm.TU.scf_271.5   scf_271:69181-78776(-)